MTDPTPTSTRYRTFGRAAHVRLRWLRRRVHADRRGATMFEYVLLLAAIGLPSYGLMVLALYVLVGHYRMLTTLNGMPVP